VWRLIVSPLAGSTPWCVGDCELDGISRLTKDNKENKGSFSPEPNGAFAVFVSFCLRTRRCIRNIRCLPAVAVLRNRIISDLSASTLQRFNDLTPRSELPA